MWVAMDNRQCTTDNEATPWPFVLWDTVGELSGWDAVFRAFMAGGESYGIKTHNSNARGSGDVCRRAPI